MGISDNDIRNYGIDITKIIAMFLVVLFHVIGCGIGFPWDTPNVEKNVVFSILEAVSLTCIDLFALSTGFLYYNKKAKYSKLILLWIQVIFWSVIPNIIIAILKKDISIVFNLPQKFLVVSFNVYWYFCAYIILFLLIPFLNYAVCKLINRRLFALILIFGFLFSLDSFFGQDAFALSKGLSFPWLSFVYIIGAAIKKNINYFVIKKKFLLIILSLFLFTCEGILIFLGKRYPLYNDVKGYNFFLISIPSILIFTFLINVNIKNHMVRKGLKILSGVSFSVYLVHLNPMVYDLFIKNKFTFVGQFSTIKAFVITIGIALSIFVVGVILGILQNNLFKLLKVTKFCEWLEIRMKYLWIKVYTKTSSIIRNRLLIF